MKKNTWLRTYLWIGCFLVITTSAIFAQTSENTHIKRECLSPLGMFRQVTGSIWSPPKGFRETFVIDEKAYLDADHWPLSELDEVDPSFKLYLMRTPSRLSSAECRQPIEVFGKLISPTGNVYNFRSATYDTSLRILKFSTIEKKGVTYNGEFEFYVSAKDVNGISESGTAKLSASSTSFGIVVKKFGFVSWNSH
jgi:hypothetical protein